ncbi:MAG: sigma-70 family RNA polymerase sigma factor [Nitrospira sp.]|nr:sigma-70 family RNA polymerase sigma factor [Nitrospira sp.]
MGLEPQPAASTLEPALVSQVARGDCQALAHLYDLSSVILYSLALRILGNREEAADLLQQIYLEIWRKGVRYDVGRGTPIAWLIALTRNRAIDRLRTYGSRTKRHPPRLPGDSPSEHPTDRSAGSFSARPDQELRECILAALASLPPAQREAIEMAYYDGLSHAEISARLNYPTGAVKTRLKLAMTKLREVLRNNEERGDRS